MSAPDFRCEKGHRLGAKRASEDAPWEPQPCYLCERVALQKETAARRKLGPVAAGIDVRKAFEVYRRQEPFVGRLGRHVTLTVAHRAEAHYSGRAWSYRQEIRVAYGPKATTAEVLVVLIHEMCHLACSAKEHHGERFRRTLRSAASKLWGIEVPLLKGSERGSMQNAAYAMDQLVITQLGEKISEIDLSLFAPDEAVKVDPAERRQALVAKRAAHTMTMLAQAERRAKIAQKALARWRAKARYYEKVAAKRGAG